MAGSHGVRGSCRRRGSYSHKGEGNAITLSLDYQNQSETSGEDSQEPSGG